MQRSERRPDSGGPEGGEGRPASRRSSGCPQRRGSGPEPREHGRGGSAAPSSADSTPKRLPKCHDLDLIVTGKQILKRAERASSLPGAHRRTWLDSLPKQRRALASPRRSVMSQSRSRDTSVDEDVSLELSQVSDFEDMNSKYGIRRQCSALATSTPKPGHKPRSGSLQSQPVARESPRRGQRSLDCNPGRQSTMSCSRDSLCRTSSSSQCRQGGSTELESPGCSMPSSAGSPAAAPDTLFSPRSQDLDDSSSCCVSTWQECGEARGEGSARAAASGGEWAHFWARYNVPPARALYDLCPTPYRNEDPTLPDFAQPRLAYPDQFPADGSYRRSPDQLTRVEEIMKSEGLRLSAKETQYVIKCTQILNGVVSRAIDRSTRGRNGTAEKIQEAEDKEKEMKRKTLTLDLRETNLPAEAEVEKRWETVTTQTDISLPNTRSAPKIFEKILRQLSKTSLDEAAEKKPEDKQNDKQEVKEEPKPES